MNALVQSFLVFLVFFYPGFLSPESDYAKTEEIHKHISYLASDELKGRGIGTPEIDSAASYISDYFQEIGLKIIPGQNGYFQEFELLERPAPLSIVLTLGGEKFMMNESIVMVVGGNLNLEEVGIAYLDFGMEEDLSGKSLEGKVVLTKMGFPEQDQMESYYSIMSKKRNMIKETGALALIEMYKSKQIPWDRMMRYFGGGGLDIKSNESQFPHFFIRDTIVYEKILAMSDTKVSILVEATEPAIIPAKNVIGFIEGTDPTLKDEVILVGAHYDHVGIGKPVFDSNNQPDSIYNGARDNAGGTVAMMLAAKALSRKPAKRPVAFIAFTAEESGLLGSRYYADHPCIPLKKTAFYLNNDNGGYNDITITTVVGAGRSNVKSAIEKGVEEENLTVYASEELDNAFFGSSDNISLSVLGVPSATISMGFKQMDSEITKYYHQPADEVETLDMNYLTKWINGFVNATINIANMEERPFWRAEDEYEALGKKLYELK